MGRNRLTRAKSSRNTIIGRHPADRTMLPFGPPSLLAAVPDIKHEKEVNGYKTLDGKLAHVFFAKPASRNARASSSDFAGNQTAGVSTSLASSFGFKSGLILITAA